MTKKKEKTIILVLLFFVILCPVQGATVQYIDSAGLGKGTLSISQPDKTIISILNSSELIEVHNSTAYIFDYQPSGFSTVQDETTGMDFPAIRFLLLYYTNPKHLGELAVFALGLLLVLLGVMGKL